MTRRTTPDADSLDISSMRLLLALLDQRSVSRAAARLGIGQSTASHALARLRRVFDDPLLLPAHGKMVPTQHALEIEADLRNILAAVDRLVDPGDRFDPASDTARFVVSSPEIFELLLVPQLHARLRAEAPGVDVAFRHSNRHLVNDWFERGEIDFRLAFLRTPPTQLHMRPLLEDSWVCLVRDGHPDIRGTLTLEQFCTTPHVALDIYGPSTGERGIDDALRAAGAPARQAPMRMQSSMTIPFTVARSDSIATVPRRFAAAFEHLPLQRLAPPLDLPPFSCTLFWHERVHRSARHVWMRNLIAEVAQQTCP